MRELLDLYKKTGSLHHAYFLVGGGEEVVSDLYKFLEKNIGVETSGNPDFWFGSFDNFSMEDAGEVLERSSNKSFDNGKKVFIIQTDFISTEAQNSLLKVFEEPTPDTHFFIISPQNNLLPTLLSRMHLVHLGFSLEISKTESILEFGLKERLEKVKEIVEAISDEEETKQSAINFVNQIEQELYSKGLEKNSKELDLCEKARSYLFNRGTPIKMVLENLVISI